MGYRCYSTGHVCHACKAVNQWPKAQGWESGNEYFFVKCWSCGEVSSTRGYWSSAPRDYAIERRRPEEGAFDWEGQEPAQNFDQCRLHCETSAETDDAEGPWFPRDGESRWEYWGSLEG